MKQLDRLPENAMSSELRRRIFENNELKGAFQRRGSTSVVTHRIFSQSTYDVQFTPPSPVGTLKVNQVDVEFIPDDKTFGGAFCYRMLIVALDTNNQPLAGVQPEIERKPVVDGRQRWSVYHTSFGYAGDTARLKFYFFTLGSGTFTANVIT